MSRDSVDSGRRSGASDHARTQSRKRPERVPLALEVMEPRRLLAAAFPGATGPAMNVTGGRGGDVYHVTSLLDNATAPAPGTLRYGIVNAPATGRTIVFDVGGTINLLPGGRQGWLGIGTSNLTIAGQTAPGGGITIIGQATKITGSNIILRHIKFRPGQDQKAPGVATNDALWITGNNVIVDHVSTSWYDDEGISTSDGAGRVTVQNAIVGNGLNYNGHGYGSLIGSDVAGSQISYNHVLYAHNKSRLPRLGNETGAINTLDFSNNVVYNWSGNGGYSGVGQLSSTNFNNNYYIYGSAGGTTIFSSGDANTSIFQSGSKIDGNKNSVAGDGTLATWTDFKGTETQASTPFVVDNTSGVETADGALTSVLARSGAFWWARDAVDTRLINETRTGTGAIISLPDAAEWNAVKNAAAVSRAAGFDTDADGMPDAWERANGFNPTAADHGGDADGDGYTNIEEYLNQLADTPDTVAPTSSVSALAAYRTPGAFAVTWAGTDNANGTGVANYDVYVSENGGAYSLWQAATTATTANFTGVAGRSYAFYSRARDRAGNQELTPATADATTRVDGVAPTSRVTALAATSPSASFTVAWAGTDEAGGSGLKNYDVYVSVNGGGYSLWRGATTALSATYTGASGSSYRFYSSARDNAGNVEAAPSTPDATTAVQTTSLASLWKFDETTGTTAADSIGGKTGTLVNMEAADWTAGVLGRALSFDGVNEHVTLGNVHGVTKNFTIAGWVKPNSLTGLQGILGKLKDVQDKQYQLSLKGTALNFQYERTGNNWEISGGTLVVGKWQHVAVTVDSTRTVRLYVNGVAVGSAVAPAEPLAGTSTAEIGRWGGTYNSNRLNGSLDDLRFYTAALAAGDVKALSVLPDATAPTSKTTVLNAVTPTTTFSVAWSGSDNIGVANYDVFVSTDGGAYTQWLGAATATTATFTGQAGKRYAFYTRARDAAGNVEAAPATPDATTLAIAATASDYFVDPTGAGAFGNGTRTYTSVQAAIAGVPAGTAAARTRVFVYRGTYSGKITISKPYISLVGTTLNAADTVLTHNLNATSSNGAGGTVGTAGSASTAVTATDFTASNLTFANSTHDGIAQAVALYLNADKAAFENCRFFGFQDTLYANKGRAYFADCYITGDTDFIFGGSAAVFDRCTMNSSDAGYITAANTNTTKSYGFVFRDCVLTANPVTEIDPITGTRYSNVTSVPAGSVYLGRPWNYGVDRSSVTFLNTKMGTHIAAAGWHPWDAGNTNPAATTRYAEYRSMNSSGTVLSTAGRVTWAKQLTAAEAAVYSLATVLAPGTGGWGSDVWEPVSVLSIVP